MDLEIIKTGDGSNTLYSKNLEEYYHSKFGAVNESKHVFINSGFKYLDKSVKHINILEIGFGTGLNALLSVLHSNNANMSVNYYGIEPFPLEEKIYQKLNYPELLAENENIYFQLHQAAWNKEVEINKFFKLYKIKNKIEETTLKPDYYHLVYFDAFAPSIQEELWTKQVFVKIRNSMKQGGIFVTYSAKGEVRRNLEASGYKTERIPGPVGKREMIRACAI